MLGNIGGIADQVSEYVDCRAPPVEDDFKPHEPLGLEPPERSSHNPKRILELTSDHLQLIVPIDQAIGAFYLISTSHASQSISSMTTSKFSVQSSFSMCHRRTRQSANVIYGMVVGQNVRIKHFRYCMQPCSKS